MKVCTDACVFGAHVAQHINSESLQINHTLDIGTGTGLLSLLLAQKIHGPIDAIEIDQAAAAQAGENFEQSPWKDRLHVINTDAMAFESNKKYDCIIANPPFFEDALHSPDERKNNAKHDTTLTLEQLVKIAELHLSEDGFFAVLLPYPRANYFTSIAQQQGLYLAKQILLRHTTNHPWFRAILYFTGKKQMNVVEEQLAIKNSEGSYTNEFTKLLADFYLKL
jgi:tRNA1Val (adenine37-N6)-methyltransferase